MFWLNALFNIALMQKSECLCFQLIVNHIFTHFSIALFSIGNQDAPPPSYKFYLWYIKMIDNSQFTVKLESATGNVYHI